MADTWDTGGAFDDVASVIRYFGVRESQPCVTCQQRSEARPGVRLCRSCLAVASACYDAIAAEERAEELAERVKQLAHEREHPDPEPIL